jgi:EF-P beta-lysylation protein EpmB
MTLADTTDFVPTAPLANDWATLFKTAVRDPRQLCRVLQLPAVWEPAAVRASREFPLFAPWSYLARIRVGDPHDPLLRQILPLDDELHDVAGFTPDPVGDGPSKRTAGLLQKYHGRALMITTGACAVHCRYCFRRHFPYSQTPPSRKAWSAAVAQLAADRSIEEIVLSGGDPLTVVDSQLSRLADMLASVPHLRRIRIHTRLPIVIPQRVTAELIDWLTTSRLVPLVVVHANHPRELDATVSSALTSLVTAGIPVLNQSVLLRGVNDDADTLVDLSQRLLDCRVLPYYLHQLDRVAGAAHFETPVKRGLELIEQLRRRLPGYAVPRYVREIAGEAAKTVLA